MSTRIYDSKSYKSTRGPDALWAEGWKAAVWPIHALTEMDAKLVAEREATNGRVGWSDVHVDAVTPVMGRDQGVHRWLAVVRYRVVRVPACEHCGVVPHDVGPYSVDHLIDCPAVRRPAVQAKK